jgi:predicted MFS family arabinose efflux permease
MDAGVRSYLIVTVGYWAFTLTDGALRMLVVLHFHQLGYSPIEVAMLFLFYEFFGIVTNLYGGWLGARVGLNRIMHIGMAMQIMALLMLTVPVSWLSIPLVMAAQALSGIAKDLNKMSAKGSVKLLVGDDHGSRLLKFVSVLTGSKNALKGAGFFVGAALLDLTGFQGALWTLASLLTVVFVLALILLNTEIGKRRNKPKFAEMFARKREINWLAGARLFLFGARDVWFVVGLPVFLSSVLGWSFMEVGAFLALWIIGYGVIQGLAPRALQPRASSQSPGGAAARGWGAMLLAVTTLIAWALGQDLDPQIVVVAGLLIFGVVFAINSALHSYLVLAYADADDVSMNVGFYYMANAAGRLLGTVLSGVLYQAAGLAGCLWAAAIMVGVALLMSLPLPEVNSGIRLTEINASD